MTFEKFSGVVDAICGKIGIPVTMSFIDGDSGKYVAAFRDGTRITGNSISGALTVMWASGHQAIYRP